MGGSMNAEQAGRANLPREHRSPSNELKAEPRSGPPLQWVWTEGVSMYGRTWGHWTIDRAQDDAPQSPDLCSK